MNNRGFPRHFERTSRTRFSLGSTSYTPMIPSLRCYKASLTLLVMGGTAPNRLLTCALAEAARGWILFETFAVAMPHQIRQTFRFGSPINIQILKPSKV